MDDPLVDTPCTTAYPAAPAETHALIFPCPEGRLIVLFMGPADEIPLFRKDPDGQWDRSCARTRVADRVGGFTNRRRCAARATSRRSTAARTAQAGR